uniref:Uncharacterized protein n=1 Tax=Zea mays TaxID=4577 RepID=A0A804RJ61_MAIZE
MDHTILSSSGKVSSIQAEVDAPHGARVGSQFLRHEQPGELLARLPVLSHLDPPYIARAGAIEAVIGGRAEAPRLPLLLLLLLLLVPIVGAAPPVRDGARQLPDAPQPPAPGLPPGLAGRGRGVIGGGRGRRGGGPLHELVHDRGAANAELELLEGEVAAGAHLPHHLLLVHLPDLELRAVVQVPDPALLLPAAGAGVPRQRGAPEPGAGSGLLRGRRWRRRGRRGRRRRAARRRVGGEAQALEQEAAALLHGGWLGDPDVVRGGQRLVLVLVLVEEVVAPAAAAAVVGVVVGGGGGGAGGGEDPIQRLVELVLLLRLPLARRFPQAPRPRRLRHCRRSGTGTHPRRARAGAVVCRRRADQSGGARPNGERIYTRGLLVSCRCYSFRSACALFVTAAATAMRAAGRRHSAPSVRTPAGKGGCRASTDGLRWSSRDEVEVGVERGTELWRWVLSTHGAIWPVANGL